MDIAIASSARFVAVCSFPAAHLCSPMCAPKVELKLVLSGGCLTEPGVLCPKKVAGRSFVRLSKSDSTLTHFLTGLRAKLHPLRDSSLFRELVVLRNSASAPPEPLGQSDEVDDLGLDQDEDKKASHRRKSGCSKLPERILNISFGGSTFSVLSGHGHLDLYIEATTENMGMLHRFVSSELTTAKSVSTESAVSEPMSALPEEASDSVQAPRTPSHSSSSLDSEGKADKRQLCCETPTKVGHDEVGTDCTRARGCTWIEKRKAWVLRYKDESGVRHQKRFRAADYTSDSSKSEAQANALFWLAEHQECTI